MRNPTKQAQLFVVLCCLFCKILISITHCCLLQMCSVTPSYSSLEEVRVRLCEIAPHLTRYDDVEPANFFKLAEKLLKVVIFCCDFLVYICCFLKLFLLIKKKEEESIYIFCPHYVL